MSVQATPLAIAVVRVIVDAPMPIDAVRAYVGSHLRGTGLRVDSIEVETPNGSSSEDAEPLYVDRDEC